MESPVASNMPSTSGRLRPQGPLVARTTADNPRFPGGADSDAPRARNEDAIDLQPCPLPTPNCCSPLLDAKAFPTRAQTISRRYPRTCDVTHLCRKEPWQTSMLSSAAAKACLLLGVAVFKATRKMRPHRPRQTGTAAMHHLRPNPGPDDGCAERDQRRLLDLQSASKRGIGCADPSVRKCAYTAMSGLPR